MSLEWLRRRRSAGPVHVERRRLVGDTKEVPQEEVRASSSLPPYGGRQAGDGDSLDKSRDLLGSRDNVA